MKQRKISLKHALFLACSLISSNIYTMPGQNPKRGRSQSANRQRSRSESPRREDRNISSSELDEIKKEKNVLTSQLAERAVEIEQQKALVKQQQQELLSAKSANERIIQKHYISLKEAVKNPLLFDIAAASFFVNGIKDLAEQSIVVKETKTENNAAEGRTIIVASYTKKALQDSLEKGLRSSLFETRLVTIVNQLEALSFALQQDKDFEKIAHLIVGLPSPDSLIEKAKESLKASFKKYFERYNAFNIGLERVSLDDGYKALLASLKDKKNDLKTLQLLDPRNLDFISRLVCTRNLDLSAYEKNVKDGGWFNKIPSKFKSLFQDKDLPEIKEQAVENMKTIHKFSKDIHAVFEYFNVKLPNEKKPYTNFNVSWKAALGFTAAAAGVYGLYKYGVLDKPINAIGGYFNSGKEYLTSTKDNLVNSWNGIDSKIRKTPIFEENVRDIMADQKVSREQAEKIVLQNKGFMEEMRAELANRDKPFNKWSALDDKSIEALEKQRAENEKAGNRWYRRNKYNDVYPDEQRIKDEARRNAEFKRIEDLGWSNDMSDAELDQLNNLPEEEYLKTLEAIRIQKKK